jgi:hypothetical protein
MWQNILNSVKTFISAFFKSAWQKELNILMPIALEVVTYVEHNYSELFDPSKRDAAFKIILSKLDDAHREIPKSLINLAIELACQEMIALSRN